MSKHQVESLEAKIEELENRIAKLESMAAAVKGSESAPGDPQVTTETGVPREILLAISAAVAAFLGKRASIRQIRLAGETPWAMQGRATVQASHGIEFVRGLR
jgi:methylmalonyl-CoA carboxyltransferase 12S subunit